jgi:hypothetical protein
MLFYFLMPTEHLVATLVIRPPNSGNRQRWVEPPNRANFVIEASLRIIAVLAAL